MIPVFLALGLWADTIPGPYVARLETQQRDGQLTIVARCLNQSNAPATLRYELRSERRGQGGSSRNTQAGSCHALPGQDVALTRTSFNASGQDFYRVRLVLLAPDGHVVAADSLVHPAQP